MKKPLSIAVLALLVAGLLAAAPAAAEPPFVHDQDRGERLAIGADGALWSVTYATIIREGADGRSTIALGDHLPGDIATGIGGDPVWVVADGLLRVRADRTVEEVDLPPDIVPLSIERGPDDRMWFLAWDYSEYVAEPFHPAGPRYGFVRADGTVELHTAPADVFGGDLGVGPDGAMWATVDEAVLRIAPDGTMQSFPVGPDPVGAPVAGPDGRVWVEVTGAVVRLATSGQEVGRTPVPVQQATYGGDPHGLAVAAGAVWIGGAYQGLARITPDGHAQALLQATPGEGAADVRPQALVARGDRLWFVNGHLDVGGVEFATVTITASPSTGVRVGQPVELVAEVRGPAGGPVPTGEVTFLAFSCCHHGMGFSGPIGTAPIGPDGRARFVGTATGQPGQGVRAWSADYAGDGRYAGNASGLASVQSTTTFSPWEGYVLGSYRSLLGREGEPEGVAYWIGVLEQTGDRGVFTGALTAGVEWRRNAVESAYDLVLGRPADLAGRDFFVDQVLGRGKRLAEVIATLASSPEYVSAHGGGDDGAWIDAMFESILGRRPDAAGRSYLLGLLAQGRSRIAVAGSIAASPEAFGISVDVTYGSLLGRAPEPAGRQYWIDRMRSGDVEAQLVASIAASDEFRVRVGG